METGCIQMLIDVNTTKGGGEGGVVTSCIKVNAYVPLEWLDFFSFQTSDLVVNGQLKYIDRWGVFHL